MRAPISWLRDFVDIALPADEVARLLTSAGIETSDVLGVGAFSGRTVVGAVETIKCLTAPAGAWEISLEVAERAVVRVISRAPGLDRLEAGDKVALALPGATIIGQGEDFELLEVAATEVAGQLSGGVLATARQLGCAGDHNAPFVVDRDAVAGLPVRSYVRPDLVTEADEVLVIEILANIARCQSMRGVAREIAAITGGAIRSRTAPPGVEFDRQPLDPLLFDRGVCNRFSEVVLLEVPVGSSPRWLTRRLILAGQQPINSVVDAANYLMLEIGQPMHVYDRDRLPSGSLAVRKSRAGERLHVLSQPPEAEPLELPAGIPVVVADEVPVAVAGIVGGTETSVRLDTRTVLVEAANFDFIAIRRAQSALRIFTDASARFSRGVDPALTTEGLRRFVEMCAGVHVLSTRDSSQGMEDLKREISLPLERATESLGVELDAELAAGFLRRAGLDATAPDQQSIVASAGSDRTDIALPCDLMEEIVRVYGYERVPETMPREPIPLHPRNDHYHQRERARDGMVLGGLQEVLTYSLTSPALDARLRYPPTVQDSGNFVAVLNPVSPERTVMRRTLLPELLACTARNLRHEPGCHVFELGQVFLPLAGSPLPSEPYRVAAVMAGAMETSSVHRQTTRNVDFFDICAVLQEFFGHLHISDVERVPATHASFHPGVCAVVQRHGIAYGHVGALHPRVAREFDLAEFEIFCFELDLEAILAASQRFFAVADVLRHPSIRTDVSVVVDESVLAAELVEVARVSGGNHVQSVEVFDVYRGESLPTGKKAVGLRLTLNAVSRTLVTAEEREIFAHVSAALVDRFGAAIRS
jgi:phenylalanyl-tRNA synthetase beta chain